MAHAEILSETAVAHGLNVAGRLTKFAAMMPDAVAVACPGRRSFRKCRTQQGKSGATYATITFAELDANATRIARGLAAWGVPAGTRLTLLVKPGIEFVTLVFGLLRARMVIVLVDPGIGRRNLVRCLAEAEPEGFVAIGAAQVLRVLLRRKFPRARWNVTVGRRWSLGGKSLDDLLAVDLEISRDPNGSPATRWDRGYSAETYADDAAAIIFTSGSTGPPKGVLYTQRMFDTQVEEIQAAYNIAPGGIDLACFPLFALFNAAMGVTTVMPEMDFSRPAAADPKKLLAAANDWKVTQAFASPAVWRVLSEHCAKTDERIGSLRQVFSCGAPVPANVLRGTLACVAKDAKMHTPYGATECMPISTIEATDVLGETATRTDEGAGVCVGRKFDSIDWRVIKITDEPIASIEDAIELPAGEVGELIVRGPQVSPIYVTGKAANPAAKVGVPISEYLVPCTQHGNESPSPALSPSFGNWHRTGDVGYIDEQGRFWYCGRKSQRVETAAGPLFTECVEGVFNRHSDVEISALVGLGRAGDQLPVVAVKFRPAVRIGRYSGAKAFAEFDELATSVIPASTICDWMEFEEMPVDIRHNSKINREILREGVSIGILAEPKLFHSELVGRARQTS